MARKPAPLRAVGDGEKAVPAAPMSVSEAAIGGSRLDLLVALRARIAKTAESADTPARDLASLSRRLLEIAKEIEAMETDLSEDDIGVAASTPDVQFGASS